MRLILPTALALCSTLGCAIDDDVSLSETEAHGTGVTTVPPLQPVSLRTIVDREVGLYQSNPRRFVGLSVIVVRDGVAGSYHYGEIADGTGIRPTDNTYYAIGSVTKTFTATLMALLEIQNIVDWNDKLSDHLPDAPAWEYPYELGGDRDRITIRDLALHRSGLWLNPSGNFERGDYEADFSALMRTLDECTGNNGPCIAPLPLDQVPQPIAGKDKFPYSNWAYSVLAHVLASKLHTTVDRAFELKLLNPLGMYHTGFKDELLEQGCLAAGETCTYADYGACTYRASCHGTFSARAAVGYDSNGSGGIQASTHQGSDQAIKLGSGTMWSTPGDMQKWLRYQMDGTGGTTDMRTIVPWLHKERADDEDSDGNATSTAFLGKYQFTDGNVRYLRKVGDIPGQFVTFFGISADRRVGVIVLSNYEPYNVTGLGERLIDALH